MCLCVCDSVVYVVHVVVSGCTRLKFRPRGVTQHPQPAKKKSPFLDNNQSTQETPSQYKVCFNSQRVSRR